MLALVCSFVGWNCSVFLPVVPLKSMVFLLSVERFLQNCSLKNEINKQKLNNIKHPGVWRLTSDRLEEDIDFDRFCLVWGMLSLLVSQSKGPYEPTREYKTTSGPFPLLRLMLHRPHPHPPPSSNVAPMGKSDDHYPSHLERAKYMRKPYGLVSGISKKSLQRSKTDLHIYPTIITRLVPG